MRDLLNDGCLAVGLEGSDYSKLSRRAEWATIPDYLFTCDITVPFEVLLDNEQTAVPIQFDVVTSWDVIEHIAEHDLFSVAENVKKHLQPGGLWIQSVSPNEEVINGVRLHQTVRAKSWWGEMFRSFGLNHMEEYVQYINTQYIRGPKYGAPGSFHLVLSSDPSQAPRIPYQRIIEVVYDIWLGSRPQRAIKRFLVGD